MRLRSRLKETYLQVRSGSAFRAGIPWPGTKKPLRGAAIYGPLGARQATPLELERLHAHGETVRAMRREDPDAQFPYPSFDEEGFDEEGG
jgi:hypothetical protein